MYLYYILKDKKPVVVDTVFEWAEFMENFENKIVKQDKIGDILVSTVFLGLDHSFMGEGEPILFETMVFSGNYDNYQERYATWEEAEKGHQRALDLVNQMMNN